MSHNLVFYGNETLKETASVVENIDGEITSLIDEMFDVMYMEKGIGLAAPQVDESKRIIVIDIQENRNERLALINPVIEEVSDITGPFDEGCLSLPGLTAEVIRPSEILISGVDYHGNEIEIEAGGLLARVFQHEVDHLNGILFIDRIEKFIRDEFRPELKKIKKLNR